MPSAALLLIPPPSSPTPPPEDPALSAVSVSPSAVTGGIGATGTVTLTLAAPVGGYIVALSSNSVRAVVPASVTVLEGAVAVTFAITTSLPTIITTAIITATAEGVTRQVSLEIDPAATPPPDPPPPPSGDGNDYHDALIIRSDYWKSYSLRDPAQLELYKEKHGQAAVINYLYPSDPDPRQQDGAKVVIAANVPSLFNQVRLPMGTVDGHTYLVTWDAWFGAEMRYANALIQNYKTFQFDSPRTPGGAATIWFEINNRWNQAPNDAGKLTARYYGTANSLIPAGPGVTNRDPVAPQLATFIIATETWTRYWVLLEQATVDSYTRISFWAADETRDAVQLLDALPFTVLGGVSKFWLEYNTSTDLTPAGERISYARNVVMLRDTVDPTSIFQRPVS